MSASAIRHPGELRWEIRLLAIVTLVLTVIGVVSCYAAGSYLPAWQREATQQAVAALIGCGVFLLVAYSNYQIWRTLARPLFAISAVGLALLAIVGVLWHGRHAPGVLDRIFPEINGAHRWIRIGVQIQVSEIARFTLAAWLAARCAALGTRVRQFDAGFLPLVAVIGAVAVCTYLEPSLSMAITLGVVGLTVVFTAGARLDHMLAVGVLAGLAVFAVLRFDPVRSHRAEVFQGTSLDCTPDVQACQSLVGFGSGGIAGVGFGRGTQKLGHMADAYSDFLLSVIGEEWGFLGVMFVVLCFGIFCWIGFRIARTAPDTFGTYLAAGLTVAVGVTAFMHAAVVTWLMPTTGLTLPFMSVGRVSLLLYLFSAAVLVSIGRHRGRPARSR